MLTPEDIQKVAQEVVRNLDAIKKPKLTQELIGSLDIYIKKNAIATSNEILSNECPEDEMWEIDIASAAISRTISSGSIILAKRIAALEGVDYNLFHQPNPTGGYVYTSDSFKIFANQFVVIKFSGCTVGDLLELWVTGIRYKIRRE